MSMATPAPRDRNDPLAAITAALEGIDFAAQEEPDGAEQLYMLSQKELNRKRKTDDFAQLRDEIKRWRSNADAQRLPHEQQWLHNLDMYKGRQFNKYDATRRVTVERVKPIDEVRVPMNFIQPAVRTELAKTSSSHPTASVQPASNDDADILAAKAAEAVWEWAYAQEKVQSRVMNPANFWRSITGNGFMKTFVDLHAEDVAATAAKMQEWRMQQREQSSEMTGLVGLPPKPEPIFGKVSMTAVNPFQLYFGDLAEPDIQRQPWIIQVALIPCERAKRIYKDVMPDDWEPKKVPPSSIFDYNRFGMRADLSGVDQTLVMEAWIKPGVSKHLPEGGLVILVDDEIVAMSEDGLPYEHGKFPFQHIYTVETGEFYRDSVINALTPLQHEYNRIFAQLIKYKNIASAPQWFYRKGAVDPSKIRNIAGTWIPITLGMEFPKIVDLPEMPQYVTGLIDAIKAVVDDISGQHQVSRAISPGADTAASAIGILREADDDFLSNTLDSIETAVEEMAQQYLACAVQIWDEPRLIKISGDDQHYSVEVLRGSDIASGMDIRTTVGTGLPQSRSARQALVKELMDGGYIDAATGLKVIAEGALGKLYSRLTIDEDYAERINVEMSRVTRAEYEEWVGTTSQAMSEIAAEDPETAALAAQAEEEGLADPQIMFPVRDWENFAVSRTVIERRMKSQEFVGYEPWKQQMFEDRWRALAAREAAMQQPAPGEEFAEDDNNAAQGTEAAYAGGDTSGAEPGAPTDEMSA